MKQLGPGVDHPPTSSAKVKERVELYVCSPFGPYDGLFYREHYLQSGLHIHRCKSKITRQIFAMQPKIVIWNLYNTLLILHPTILVVYPSILKTLIYTFYYILHISMYILGVLRYTSKHGFLPIHVLRDLYV